MLDWKRPRWCVDRNLHISISDGWRILCERCLANSSSSLQYGASLTFFRCGVTTSSSLTCTLFALTSSHLFLGFFKGLVRDGTHFLPFALNQYGAATCFQFPCLSRYGSSCRSGKKRSNLRPPGLPSQLILLGPRCSAHVD